MFKGAGWVPWRNDVSGPYGMPAASDLKLKFMSAPSIGLTREEIAKKFHSMLRK